MSVRCLLAVLGCLLCCAALAPAGAQPLPNLAPNPGLELGEGALPLCWEKRTPDDARRRLAWSTERPHGGQRCLGIDNLAEVQSRWRAGQAGDLRLQPGTRCRFSAWIRTEGAGVRAWLVLYFLDARGAIIAQPASPPVQGTCDWSQREVQATVPEQPACALLYLECQGSGRAWFDDVALVAAATGEPPLYPAPAVVFTPDCFWSLSNYEVVSREGRSMLQVPPGSAAEPGEALLYCTLPSARYEVRLDYLDEPDGAGTLELLLNGTSLGKHTGNETPAGGQDTLRTWVLPGVDLQRHSRLVLRGRAGEGEHARVASISLRPVGAFRGKLLSEAELPPLPDLRLYGEPAEERKGRAMLAEFIHARGLKPAHDRREAELAALKTPADWQAYLAALRGRLADFFGPFPERTPLRPRVTGTLARGSHAIEKVIFESRPGYYVTANFYRPTPLPAGRVPGLLLVCGHSAEGKGYHLYHETALGLVLKGYAVLAIDPTGQGERSEYFDPTSLANRVPLTVGQHHQVGRPAFLVGQTLAGLRTWDAIRAVDYLVSRPEVDATRLGVVGNSGGGQMALLVTAADQRVQACAAAHPGGSMENTYLCGQFRDRDLLSLIAPRPCRFIVGKESGETGHVARMEDLRRFYRGLGVPEGRCDLVWVDGVHDLKQPKREAAYEWLNRWLGKPEAGAGEPPLQPLMAQELWCTASGFALKSLGGESAVTLHAARLRELAPRRETPTTAAEAEQQVARLRRAVTRRTGLRVPAQRTPPEAAVRDTWQGEGYAVQGLELRIEAGITVPAQLWRPETCRGPVVLHVPERGKPARADVPSLPRELCRGGCTVLSVDVRGVGESDPRGGRRAASAAGYDPDELVRDSLAINAYAALGRTLDAMRALDVIGAADYLRARPESAAQPLRVVGEGQGGLWALLAAALDPDLSAVATIGTLPSYRLLVENPYYELRGYFWSPGVVRDFDIAELSILCGPGGALWLNPVDQMAQPLPERRFHALAAWSEAVCAATGVPLLLRRSGPSPSELALALQESRWGTGRPPH